MYNSEIFRDFWNTGATMAMRMLRLTKLERILRIMKAAPPQFVPRARVRLHSGIVSILGIPYMCSSAPVDAGATLRGAVSRPLACVCRLLGLSPAPLKQTTNT